MALLVIGLLSLGAAFGVIATLVFQGGETTGRLAQHARDLQCAWDKADGFEAKSVHLELTLKNERDQHETLWANMALAIDSEARKNLTIESRRVETWKALDLAIRELHANPDPKCGACGDSIGRPVDDLCFLCGLEAKEDPFSDYNNPRAQA